MQSLQLHIAAFYQAAEAYPYFQLFPGIRQM